MVSTSANMDTPIFCATAGETLTAEVEVDITINGGNQSIVELARDQVELIGSEFLVAPISECSRSEGTSAQIATGNHTVQCIDVGMTQYPTQINKNNNKNKNLENYNNKNFDVEVECNLLPKYFEDIRQYILCDFDVEDSESLPPLTDFVPFEEDEDLIQEREDNLAFFEYLLTLRELRVEQGFIRMNDEIISDIWTLFVEEVPDYDEMLEQLSLMISNSPLGAYPVLEADMEVECSMEERVSKEIFDTFGKDSFDFYVPLSDRQMVYNDYMFNINAERSRFNILDDIAVLSLLDLFYFTQDLGMRQQLEKNRIKRIKIRKFKAQRQYWRKVYNASIEWMNHLNFFVDYTAKIFKENPSIKVIIDLNSKSKYVRCNDSFRRVSIFAVFVESRRGCNKKKNEHKPKEEKPLDFNRILVNAARKTGSKNIKKEREQLRLLKEVIKDSSLPLENDLLIKSVSDTLEKFKLKKKDVSKPSKYKKLKGPKVNIEMLSVFKNLYTPVDAIMESLKSKFRDHWNSMPDNREFEEEPLDYQALETFFNNFLKIGMENNMDYRFERRNSVVGKTYKQAIDIVENFYIKNSTFVMKLLVFFVNSMFASNFQNILSTFYIFDAANPLRRGIIRMAIFSMLAFGFDKSMDLYDFVKEFNNSSTVEVEVEQLQEDFSKIKENKLDTIMKVVENLPSNRPIVSIFKKFVVLVLLTPLSAALNLEEWRITKFMNYIFDQLSDKLKFMDYIQSFMKEVTRVISKCISSRSIWPLFECDDVVQFYEDVRKHINHSTLVEIKNDVSTQAMTKEYLEEGQLLHRKGIRLLQKLPRNDIGEINTLNQTLRMLFDHINNVYAEMGIGSMREQSFFYGLISQPRMGKSSFRQKCDMVAGAVYGVPYGNNLVGRMIAGDKYNSGIKQHHKFICVDDIDKAVADNEISPWLNVVRLVDNLVMPLNTAEVTTKGKLAPRPISVSVTSNANNFGVTGLSDYLFFFKRMDHLVKIYPAKAEYALDSSLHESEWLLDDEKTIGVDPDSLYKIVVYINDRTFDARKANQKTERYMIPSGDVFYSVKEYLDFFAARVEKHRMKQQRYLDSFKDQEICLCNYPKLLCKCVTKEITLDVKVENFLDVIINLQFYCFIFALLYSYRSDIRFFLRGLQLKFYEICMNTAGEIVLTNLPAVTEVAEKTIVEIIKRKKLLIEIKYRYLLRYLQKVLKDNSDMIKGLGILAGCLVAYKVYDRIQPLKRKEKIIKPEALIADFDPRPVGRNHVFTKRNVVLSTKELNTFIYGGNKEIDALMEQLKGCVYKICFHFSETSNNYLWCLDLGNKFFLANAHGFLTDPYKKDCSTYFDKIRVTISRGFSKDCVLETITSYVLEKDISYVLHSSKDFAVFYMPGAPLTKGCFEMLSNSLQINDEIQSRSCLQYDKENNEFVKSPISDMDYFQFKYLCYNDVNIIYKGVKTEKGDCGLPLITYRNGSVVVPGIHAGSIHDTQTKQATMKKVAAKTDKDEVKLLIDKLVKAKNLQYGVETENYFAIDGGYDEAKIHLANYIHPRCSMLVDAYNEFTPIGNIEYVQKPGEEKKRYQVSSNFRSKVVSNPAGKFIAPELLEYAASDPFVLPVVSRQVNEDGSYSHPDYIYASDVHDEGNISSTYVAKLFKEFYKGFDKLEGHSLLKPQTLDEAIIGYSDNLISNKVKLNSSAGFPRKGPKSKYIEVFDGKVLRNELENEVKRIIDMATKGFRIVPYFERNFKDEAMKVSKVKQKGARIYMCSAAAYNIYCKMYLDPLMVFITMHREFFRVLFGVNIASHEVYEYLDMMKAFNNQFKYFDGDISNLDRRIQVAIKEAINELCETLLKGTKYTEEELYHVRAILESWIGSLIGMSGDVFYISCVLVSGAWYTALFGTLVCIAYFLIVHDLHKKKYSLEYDIRTYSPSAFCGDDNQIGVHEDIQKTFTFAFYRDCLASIGIKYTPPDKKSDDMELKTFFETEILKRKIVYNDYLEEYVAILDPMSLSKMMSCIARTEVSIETQIEGILTVLLMETFLHKAEVYEEYRNRILAWIKKENANVKLPTLVLSRENLHSRYKQNKFNVWTTEGETQFVHFKEGVLSAPKDELSLKENEALDVLHRDLVMGRITIDKGRLSIETNDLSVKRPAELLIVIESSLQYNFTAENNDNNNSGAGDAPLTENINEGMPTNVPLATFDSLGGTIKVEPDEVIARPLLDAVHPADELTDFLTKRWIHAATWVWSDTIGSGSAIGSPFGAWSVMLNSPQIERKIQNFARISGSLRIRYFIKAPPTWYGHAVIYALPKRNYEYPNGESVFMVNDTHTMWNCFHMRHLDVVPNISQEGEIVLPWIHDTSYYKIEAGSVEPPQWDIGCFCIAPLMNALDIVTPGQPTLNISVWCKFEEVNLTVPMIVESGKNDSSFMKSVKNLQKSKMVSMTASKIAKTAGALSNVPIIGDAAKVISTSASMISDVATQFGFSKPAAEYKYLRVKPVANSNLSTVDNVDYSVPLSLSSNNQVSVDQALGDDSRTDNMDFATFFKHKTLVYYDTVDIGTPTDTVMKVIPVTPMHCMLIGDVAYPTPAGLVGTLFRHWRGTMHYQVKIFCSAVHRFQYKINYFPFSPGFSGDNGNSTYTIFVDASVDNTVNFSVGWASLNYAQECGFLGATGIGSVQHNGFFTLTVVNPPTCSGTGNAYIYYEIYAWADEDMQFYNYGSMQNANEEVSIEMFSETAVAGAVSGQNNQKDYELVPRAHTDVSGIICGESIGSLRALMKQPVWQANCMIDCSDIDNLGVTSPDIATIACIHPHGLMPRYNNSGIRFNTGRSGQAAYIPKTALNLIPICFLGYRGSLKYKFVSHFQNNTMPSSNQTYQVFAPLRIGLHYAPVIQQYYSTNKALFDSGYNSNMRYNLMVNDTLPNRMETRFRLNEFLYPNNSGIGEITIPYYSNKRYKAVHWYPNDNDLISDMPSQPYECFVLSYTTNIYPKSGDVVIQAGLHPMGSIYQSVGEDFSLVCFRYVPAMRVSYVT